MHESLRAQLHERLDQILDQRCELEPPPVNNLSTLLDLSAFLPPILPSIPPEAAHRLWISAIALARDLLGDAVRASAIQRHYKEESKQRSLFQSWLSDLWPLLHVPPTFLGIAPQSELTIFEVIDALSALDAGEIRPLFVANTGKNRRANRWSVANAKLEALTWKKRLKALGYAEKAANFEVTMAFGEQWDTIRKWKAQCEQILGTEHVRVALGYAGSPNDAYVRQPKAGLFGAVNPDPLKSLQTAGTAYRREVQRSAELSKRKSRAAA